MNKFQGHRAHSAAAALVTAALLSAGLLASTSALASRAFDNKMSTVIAHVKADPGYKVLPLSTTADREWFVTKSEALYEKKISKEQYVAEGAKAYPGYDASFTELADLITAP
ncbi:MAG: hypothetical protein ABJD97_03435 [Betaproteobacteria bacterium]